MNGDGWQWRWWRDGWCQCLQGVGDGGVLLVDSPSECLSEVRVLRYGKVSGVCGHLTLDLITRGRHTGSSGGDTGTTGGTSVPDCTEHCQTPWTLMLLFLSSPFFFSLLWYNFIRSINVILTVYAWSSFLVSQNIFAGAILAKTDKRGTRTR